MEEFSEPPAIDLDALIAQQDSPVVIDFWAAWSFACLLYKEKLMELERFVHDFTLFKSINIDIYPEITEKYGIITIPTTLIFYQGEIHKQLIGVQDVSYLQEILLDLKFPDRNDNLPQPLET